MYKSWSITFLSSLTGCSGVSGRSLQPGRMHSGGLKSTQSFSEARLFPTLSLSGAKNKEKRLKIYWQKCSEKTWCEDVMREHHHCRLGCKKKWGKIVNCSSLHCMHLQGRGSSEDHVHVWGEDEHHALSRTLQQDRKDACKVLISILHMAIRWLTRRRTYHECIMIPTLLSKSMILYPIQ